MTLAAPSKAKEETPKPARGARVVGTYVGGIAAVTHWVVNALPVVRVRCSRLTLFSEK